MIIETRAYARAGLLGNPSDGYFGKTISVSIRNFGANVQLYESPKLVIEDTEDDKNVFKSIGQLNEKISQTGYYGGTRLIKSSIRKFYQYCSNNSIRLQNKNFTISYKTSIPRQVGLAGSSAIITATFKALIEFYGVDIPKPILPSLILATEVEDLGINAGLQDRVIQVYEGCVYMDFKKEHLEEKNYGIYKELAPEKLHNLYLAYKTDLSKVSGAVLNNIKERYDNGEELVHKTLNDIAQCAEDGKKAIDANQFDDLNNLINKNFDLRCTIMNISDSNMELVNTARNCGASAKFSGSGGAIIGMYKDDAMLQKLVVELKKINARVIKPLVY